METRMAVPTYVLGALNAFAVIAKAQTPVDTSTLSVLEQVAQMLDFAIGNNSLYTSATTSTMAIVTPSFYPPQSATVQPVDTSFVGGVGPGLPGSAW
jgi:hypothetical protein